MDVLPNEDELQIQSAAAEFLAGECSPALVRQAEKNPTRHAPELWKKFAANGWLQLCLSHEVGGEALSLTHLGLLFEEVGYHIAPLPIHGTVVASLMIDRHGQGRHAELLRTVIAGDAVLACAVTEQDGRWSPDAIALQGRLEGDQLVLDGEKYFVAGYAAASHCLVAFRDEAGELGLALVAATAAGLSHEELVPLAKDGECIVRLRGVRVPREVVIASGAAGRAIVREMMDLSAVLHASLMAGAARKTLDLAVEHARQREAFGQPIGAFQAIQHLCANMLNAVDGTQLLAREALWRMQEGLPVERQVAQAKAFANEQCVMVCRSAQQIFGGMGFMQEFDLNLWYRRVASWSVRSGSVSEHRRTISATLLSATGTVRIGYVDSPAA